MKKKIMILMVGFLLIGANLYAQGDLVVGGHLSVGLENTNARLNVDTTSDPFGLNLLNTRDTTSPVMGASYYVFLDGTGSVYSSEAGGFSNTVVYRRQTSTDSGSLLYAGLNTAYVGITGGSGYTVDNMAGNLIVTGMHDGFNSTVTLNNGYGLLSRGLDKAGSGSLSVDDFRHIYLRNRGNQGGTSTLTVTQQTGLWIDNQTMGDTVNYGIVLNGDGAGSDIVFGPTQSERIYSSSGRLYAEDASGNKTILSPHDPETGEWIFYSKNIRTGKTVRVNMEKLVRAVEKLTGETFMVESIEK